MTTRVYTWRKSSVPAGCDTVSPMVWYRPDDDLDAVITELAGQPDPCLFIRHAEAHDPLAFHAPLLHRMASGLDHRPGYAYWLERFARMAEAGVEPALVVTEYEGQASIGHAQLHDMLKAYGDDWETAEAKIIEWVKRVQGAPHVRDTSLGRIEAKSDKLSIEERMLMSDHACTIVWEWLNNTIARAWREVYGTECPLSNYGYAPYHMTDPHGHRMQRVDVPLAAPVAYVRPVQMTRNEYAEMLVRDIEAASCDSVWWVNMRYFGTPSKGRYDTPDDAAVRVVKAIAESPHTRAVIWWTGEAASDEETVAWLALLMRGAV